MNDDREETANAVSGRVAELKNGSEDKITVGCCHDL
jgi:hypothetical protein